MALLTRVLNQDTLLKVHLTGCTLQLYHVFVNDSCLLNCHHGGTETM